METKNQETLDFGQTARLRVGMRVKLPASGVFDVTLVNESRAHIVPVKKADGGNGYEIDISPNSEVEIL